MSEISMFSQYSGKENTISNACGYVLKSLYAENPFLFEDFLSQLVNLNEIGSLIMSFETQKPVKKSEKTSISDIRISQTGFEIYVEVKRSDWFKETQIKNYIKNFSKNSAVKIMILLSPEFSIDTEKIVKKLIKQNIAIALVTFEKLITELKQIQGISLHLRNIISEFEKLLSLNDLISEWKFRLDIVNTAKTGKKIDVSNEFNDISYHFYVCPAIGGGYNHKRSKYFAPYSNKKIDVLYEIENICVVDNNGETSWRYPKSGKLKTAEIVEYIKRDELYKSELKKYPLQVFCLKSRTPLTKPFKKTSRGGMFGSKIYFNFNKEDSKDIKTLAETISDKSWEDFKK